MRVIIESDYRSLSEWAANYVAKRINEFQVPAIFRTSFCIGLAYGLFPIGHV